MSGVRRRAKAMNWKVLVEQFLEGYHIRSTHRETFFPVQYDDLNVVETFGPNSRSPTRTATSNGSATAPSRLERRATGHVRVPAVPERDGGDVPRPGHRHRHRPHRRRPLAAHDLHVVRADRAIADGGHADDHDRRRRRTTAARSRRASRTTPCRAACNRARPAAPTRSSSSAATRAPSGTSTASSPTSSQRPTGGERRDDRAPALRDVGRRSPPSRWTGRRASTRCVPR